MSWSYGNDPSASDKDYVRFRIGDTDTTDQLVQDEEINGAVALTSTKQQAALLTAKALLAKWARFVDTKMGKLSLALSQRIRALQALIPDLEDEAGTLGGALGVPYMAADSLSERKAVTDDTDRLEPAFALAMHDIVRQHSESNDTFDELRP
jgi:hypothetical protein